MAMLLGPLAALHGEEGEKLIKVTISGVTDEVKDNILALKPSFIPDCSATPEEVEKFKDAADPKIDSPYARGETFRHDKYEAFKGKLDAYASRMGYLDASFTTHEILVDPAAGVADVHIVLETGSRYRFGKVTVDQSVLSPDYFEKYIQIREGDDFSTDVLVQQQQLIQDRGYYGNVRVRALYRQAKNRQVPVEITAGPNKRALYRGRIGYGTDTGFRMGFDYERRWLDRKGSQLRATINYSETEVYTNLSYIVPAKKRLNEYMRYYISGTREYGEDVDSKTFEVGAEYHRIRSSGWEQILLVKYLNDVTQTEGEPELETQFMIAGVRMQKSVADNPIFTRKGWHLRADLQGAYEGFISSTNFLQTTLYAKLIRPAGEKGRLIGRSEIGATMIDDVSLLPKSLRYFAGGDNSVRGYDYESLGETNAEGAVIGGKHVLVASLEYEYLFKDPWGAALFVDVGNAFNDWSDMGLKTGVGFGARWKSPIGPVRVDIAWPTDDFGDPHLHLSIGPDF
ncbi:MAG: autotransporter assembly complex protein TamA [Gammaproteobacteria bacterium]